MAISRVIVDATGASNGVVLSQLLSRGMSPVVQVDATGTETSSGATLDQLRSRGIVAFCQIDQTGVDPVSGVTVQQLAQRGILGLCPVDSSGIAQNGTLTVDQLQQRGLKPFLPTDETGAAKTIGGIILSSRNIAENSANGTTLGTASLPASYTGTAVWSLTDASSTFQINSSTGVITVLSNTALNYEVNTSLPITISVSGVSPSAPDYNVSITITNVIETPANTALPVISGTTQVGFTLSVTNGTWTDMAGPGSATYAYQWKSGVTNVGTNTNTYTLVHSDDAATITCVVTATNTAGSQGATTAGVGPVVEAPSNTVAPSISGTAQSGQTLTATTGTWQGDATITYAYQWNANGSAIPGATSSTFVLTNTQVGANITCVVTGTNSVGSASATSNSLGPVTSAPTAPANTVAPVASGSATIGAVLSTTDGTWTGTPTITYTYQWNNGADIVGATSNTYTVQAGDNGLNIFCKVTGTNGVGNSTANSNSIGPIGTAASVIVDQSGNVIVDQSGNSILA